MQNEGLIHNNLWDFNLHKQMRATVLALSEYKDCLPTTTKAKKVYTNPGQ